MYEFGLQSSFVELCSLLQASVIPNCVPQTRMRLSRGSLSNMLGRARLKRCRTSACWKGAKVEGGLYFKGFKSHIEFSSLGHCFLQKAQSETELRFLMVLYKFKRCFECETEGRQYVLA